MQHIVLKIVDEVKKVIVGKDEIIEKVIAVILAGGHILLEDVPGVGKTTLALAFSKSMGLNYSRIQFTPDTMASDIVGFSVYNKQTGGFDYQKGAVFCNMLLADEINRTSSKTQSALLEVMEEGRVTVDGNTYQLPKPFVCIATQNPIGAAGTQNLPDSQLDRFMIRLSMGYPTLQNQIDIIKNRLESNPLNAVQPVCNEELLLNMSKEVQQVYISDEIIAYCAQLCEKTRDHEAVLQGVSPRAVQAMVQLAKANAFINDRNYVIPDDIADFFEATCAHRLILRPQAKINHITASTVLSDILKTVPVPAI